MKKPATLVVLAAALSFVFPGTPAAAQSTIYNFTPQSGNNSYATPAFDAHGNLYVTTTDGGGGDGTLVELIPSNGSWTAKVRWFFGKNPGDGSDPYAGVIFDRAGNLYGTTANGGANGVGTVYKMTPTGSGFYTETILYSFIAGSTDGANPYCTLVFDNLGNLYGTTTAGGTFGDGTVFELSRERGYAETILYNFNRSGTGDWYPYAGLALDPFGNLYGTTVRGGQYGGGAAFELMPGDGGVWTQNILHSFGARRTDGSTPYGGLIFDNLGNLYGTTQGGGGPNALGTVFQLSPRENGTWAETILADLGPDLGEPHAGLAMDSQGNLFGTGQYGTFELTPIEGGGWSLSRNGVFVRPGGVHCYSGLVLSGDGTALYGTTSEGGTYNNGTVFEITQ